MIRRERPCSFALTLALLLCATNSTALAQHLASPDQKGPYNVGAQLFNATMTGGRVARVQVFYPTLSPSDAGSSYTVNIVTGSYQIRSPLGAAHNSPIAPGAFPLVVHDHGGGPAGQDFQRLAQLPLHELMASYGFIVVVALHSGNEIDRVRDLPLVIDACLARSSTVGDLFFQRIDAGRIGISGQSAGGSAALGAAGGLTAQGIAADARLKAMVVYEPAILSMSDAQRIAIPYMVMGGLQSPNGQAMPSLFGSTTLSTPRLYVQTARAVHQSYVTSLPDEIDQAREQALAALGPGVEPLTTLIPANAAAARAYTLWNNGAIMFPAFGPGFGGGRNLCDRVGLNSIRPLDLDGDGFTDSPPFLLDDPPYMPQRPIRAEVMIPMVKLYTVAFWKTRLEGDHRYQRYLAPGYAQSQNLEATVFVGE